MKLIDKNTGKTLYSVLGGENLTLDEAIEWAGAEVITDPNPGDPDYIINGEECWYDDLDWVVDSYQPDDEPEEPKSWAVRIALLHEDFPYDDETKAYYGFDEAEEDARFIAERIDKWEDSHSRRSRRPDDLPTDGGVDGYEIAFESSPELHIILNTQPAEKLLYSYVIDDGNLLKVVDEDAEGGIELRELLETKHSSAVELRFSYSFAELAKEVIIDQGKRITAEEAIKRYGFLRLINDIFAQKCSVYKDYALDIIGEYHENYDDDEKNDYYDDEHNYAHTLKRLAEPGYHMTQVELIEKLAKSDCFPGGRSFNQVNGKCRETLSQKYYVSSGGIIMLLSDFHRLRTDAEECSSLDEFISEVGGSLPEECYPADMSGDAPIKILTTIWELAHDFNFRKLRAISGMTQAEFVREYRIPRRTIEHWDVDERTPPSYVLELLAADVVSAKIKEVMEEN